MNGQTRDAQTLANKYHAGIKEIRLITKGSHPDLAHIITPAETISPEPAKTPQNITTYQQDFGEYTERYRDIIQEVRVIFKDGAGASQFFPKGTDERLVWASVIPKEELI